MSMNNDSLTWRKSTRSAAQGNCVEVADVREQGTVAVRDSKDPGQGHFTVSRQEFARLVQAIKGGDIS